MDVVVLGAGVAGVASAISLAMHGHSVRIFERRTSAGTLGAGIVLWPNASFVLEQLGLSSELAAFGGRPKAMQRFDSVGNPLDQLDIRELEGIMGFPSYAVLRRDLQRVSLDRLAQLGVNVEYGQFAQLITEREGMPWLEFAGREPVTADLIVGADGRMSSAARRYVAPNSPAVYQGFSNWVGVAESDQPWVDPNAILDFWGTGLRFGIVPLDPRRAYWAGGRREPLDDASPANPWAEVQAVFRDWPEVVRRTITNSAPSSVHKIFVHDVDPLDTWHRGRVLLIGDAAHAPLPTSGQGACQALEDAWHLARYLPTDARDLEASLAMFTAQRSAKTRSITLAGRHFAQSLFHLDAAGSARRDTAARSSLGKSAAPGIAQLWGAGLPL